MRMFDCHVHSWWPDLKKASELLGNLDKAGFEGAIVMSPIPEAHDKGACDETNRESVDFVVEFTSADRDRLVPFATIAPQVKGAADVVRYAKDKGCTGVKMLPNHWYPYDRDLLFPVYEAAQEAGLPIIFHSGILYGYEDSSRFCRPVYYEAMLHFPKVKFALAHISWPWTDECIATFGRMRAYAREKKLEQQMYIDCTPGTPRFYRSDAMDKAIKFCAESFEDHYRCDLGILRDELKMPQADLEAFFCANLMKFLGKE